MAMSGAPLSATYHRVRRKNGHNVAVTALARKRVVLVWHLLRKGEPYRDAPVARTRHKLRRVSPGARPAPAGQVPTTLEAVYAEAGLPVLAASTAAEVREGGPSRPLQRVVGGPILLRPLITQPPAPDECGATPAPHRPWLDKGPSEAAGSSRTRERSRRTWPGAAPCRA